MRTKDPVAQAIITSAGSSLIIGPLVGAVGAILYSLTMRQLIGVALSAALASYIVILLTTLILHHLKEQ